MDREKAAGAFVRMAYESGVQQGLGAVSEFLEGRGSAGEEWRKAGEWTRSLSTEDRRVLSFLLRQAAVQAVTGVLVNLDGVSGYCHVDGQPVEFSVAMTAVESGAAAAASETLTITIAPAERGEDLHDIFFHVVASAEH